MLERSIGLEAAVRDYLLAVGTREHPVLEQCRLETAAHPDGDMQIAPEQGALLQMLVRLTGVSRALEIGMFTGYSTLAVALAMEPAGRLVTIEVDTDVIATARRYFAAAGVADRIEVIPRPALDALAELVAADARFDFVFLDADKTEYPDYYEAVLPMVPSGGLILLDNMLWDGTVADPDYHSDEADALRSLGSRIHEDDRVDHCLVPVGDGMSICRKR